MRCLPLVATAGVAAGPVPAADTGFSSGIGLDEQPRQQQSEPSKPDEDGPGRSWWQIDTGPALAIEHAGEFERRSDGQPTIGLLFSKPFPEDGTFNDFLAVYQPDGTPIRRQWRRAANPQLLYVHVPGPGEYLVRVRAGLSAGGTATLTRSVSGPVTIPPQGESE